MCKRKFYIIYDIYFTYTGCSFKIISRNRSWEVLKWTPCISSYSRNVFGLRGERSLQSNSFVLRTDSKLVYFPYAGFCAPFSFSLVLWSDLSVLRSTRQTNQKLGQNMTGMRTGLCAICSFLFENQTLSKYQTRSIFNKI